MENYKELLKKKYDDIWESSKQALLQNNVEVDSNLSDIENDKRKGLSAIITITGDCLDNFSKIKNEIRKIEPEQYYYPQTDIHVTILTLIHTSENFVFDEEKAETFKEILEKTTRNFPKFDIEFKGLTASKGVVMVQGFFNKTLNEMREAKRDEKKKHELEINQRQKGGIGHCTIIRFKQKLRNPMAFVNKIEELRNISLGTFKVKKIHFVLHDWCNSEAKRKVLAEYELK